MLPRVFFVIEIEAIVVLRAVGKLKNSFASGYVQLPGSVLKKIFHIVVRPLRYIIYRDFVSGKFPFALKLSVMTPSYKSAPVDNLDNYRSINLPTIS